MKREAFGKTLMDQPVVRHRLAKAGAELESLWAWLETFVYQLSKLPKETADKELGGLTALAKAKAGMVLATCAEVAVLLFGGNGYTRSRCRFPDYHDSFANEAIQLAKERLRKVSPLSCARAVGETRRSPN